MRSAPPKSTLPEGIFRARDVPAKLRPGIPAGALVRVQVVEVVTENGFTPAEEQEILQASAEVRRGENVISFETAEDAVSYLESLTGGTAGQA